MKEKTTKYEAKKIWYTKRMIQENPNEKPNKTENNKPKNTKRIPPIFILFGVHLRCFWSMWRIKRKALPEWCAMWLIFPSYFACIHILSIVSSVLGVLCFVLCALCLVSCSMYIYRVHTIFHPNITSVAFELNGCLNNFRVILRTLCFDKKSFQFIQPLTDINLCEPTTVEFIR